MRVAVFGAEGKMGSRIASIVRKDKKLKLVACVVEQKQGRPLPFCELDDLKNLRPEVIIDFSTATGTKRLLNWLNKNPVPLVSGTTGLTAADFKRLNALGKKRKIFWAPNMSPGVAVLREAVKMIAQNLPGFDATLYEVHHIHKKDKPSGTALAFYTDLLNSKKRGKNIAFPDSERRGSVFGIHRIRFVRGQEEITIEHKATSRDLFASEAVNIARWIATKSRPGMYGMADYLAATWKK